MNQMAGDQEGRKNRGEVPEKNHLRSAEGVELSERKASDNSQVLANMKFSSFKVVAPYIKYLASFVKHDFS